MTYFFHRKFNIDEARLGSIFSGLAVITACSVLVASSIAKRIGNVKVWADETEDSFLKLMIVHRLWLSPTSHPL